MKRYRYRTEHPHYDSTQTMNDFLNNHLQGVYWVVFKDGTYAKIENRYTGKRFAVHAGGDGDSCVNSSYF